MERSPVATTELGRLPSVSALPEAVTEGACSMPKHPNLLIIKADELRHDSLGCTGHPVLRTPHLDRLAAAGTRFANACTVSTLCVPSRASFFTGQYVHTHRGWGNGQSHHIGLHQAALPRWLKEAGYATALVGKNHAFQNDYCDRWFDVREEYSHWNKNHGDIRDTDRAVADYRLHDPRPEFAHFGPASGCALLGEGLIDHPEPFPPEQCFTARIAEDALAFLDRQTGSALPFFLHLSFPDPHWPITVCEPYFSMYPPASLPPLEAWPMDWDGHPFKHFVQSQACGNDRYTEAERRRILATYYGQVSFIDTAVGRVLDRLATLGLEANTLVVFTADHGNFAGRYGLVGKTGGFMDALLRIPLILRGPGIPTGATCRAQVSNIDVVPTVLGLAGLPVPESVQGRAFGHCLADPASGHRDAVFAEVGAPQPPPPPVPRSDYAEHNRRRTEQDGWFWFCDYASHGRSAAIRTAEWKYVFYVGDCEELYDLTHDPCEVRNLAADPAHAARRDELKNRLLAWLLSAPFGSEPGLPKP